MNSEYFYETHEKPCENGMQFEITSQECRAETKINVEINHNPTNEDYEIVTNEEFDADEKQAQAATLQKDVANTNTATHNGDFRLNYENSEKLQLSLSAEKIALKSQTMKTNKSITPETEACDNSAKTLTKQSKQMVEAATTTTTTKTVTLYQPQAQRGKRAEAQSVAPPINFTILPISTAPRRTSGGNEGAKNLPEIVLTSFEARSIMSQKSPTAATATTKATSVTFQRVTSPTRQIAPPSQRQQQQQLNNTQLISKILPSTETVKQRKLSTGGSILNNNNKHGQKLPKSSVQIAEAETIERSCDTEESSASNSQVGSSTSPESLMDNVLSAASSLSVRSSSSSNGNGSTLDRQERHDAGGSAINLPTLAASAIVSAKEGRNGKSAFVKLAGLTATNATAKKMHHSNRALNPESAELKMSPSFLQPSLSVTTMPALPSQLQLANEIQTLQLPASPQAVELSETHSNHHSRSPLPSRSIAIRTAADSSLFPDELKCSICMEVLRDPRTLNCLHSFCFQCLVDENFKQDSSIPFWSQPGADADSNDWKGTAKSNYSFRSSSPEISLRSASDSGMSPMSQRKSSFNFIRKKSMDKILLKKKSDSKGSECASSVRLNSSTEDRQRVIICKICNFCTELPVGGIRQLLQNFVLVRKIEEVKLRSGDEVISCVWCSLCFDEISATYHCITCTLNLCTLCKESHVRQRTTTDHKIKNLIELRRARKQQQNILGDNTKFSLKCGMHPGFEMKAFCTTCLQVACADCLVLLHKGHKYEPIAKAITNYVKILRDAAEQTRPLCTYAEHSIERLNEIAININRKCDETQAEVDTFLQQYFEALEVHRKTLTQQVRRARESKVDMILEQQLDLEKRTNEAVEAVRFSQELSDIASDVEILSFINLLLKRFEYCQQFRTPIDPKISDSLHFLPKIRAPFAKTQNGIPLFGIIAMQTVEPSLCTLQWEGFTQLRLHKKVELLLLSRDADGVALCHGGLEINALLKYKDNNLKFLPVEVSDNRDGTYNVAFTPDSQGSLLLTVTINDKYIKGNPFTFPVRTLQPHTGIYHCCTFCSSKGNKLVKCCCEGRMPGYAGCGHGHVGHPGRRHWSCCANVLENSECNVANKMLNS